MFSDLYILHCSKMELDTGTYLNYKFDSNLIISIH
jgi:hypothetical protein